MMLKKNTAAGGGGAALSLVRLLVPRLELSNLGWLRCGGRGGGGGVGKLCRRSFASTSMRETRSDARERIVSAALLRVPEYSWTKEALALGAVDAGFPASAHGLLRNGAGDLVGEFSRAANAHCRSILPVELLEDEEVSNNGIEREPLNAPQGQAFVSAALQNRLRYVAENTPLSKWPAGIAISLEPSSLPSTLKILADLSDDVCTALESKSTATSRIDSVEAKIARRVSVGMLYVAAEMFMLTDRSESYRDTAHFIDRRVKDAAAAADMAADSKSIASAAMTGLFSLFSSGASMLGVDSDALRNIIKDRVINRDSHHDVSEHKEKNENENENGSGEPSPLSLPEGETFFSLLGMDSGEVSAMLRAANPGFTIVESCTEDVEGEEATRHESPGRATFVRLLVSSRGKVVDILRE